ncbi:LuxR C-terminal-related transcriptional regulator [Microbacterium sp. JZ101]
MEEDEERHGLRSAVFEALADERWRDAMLLVERGFGALLAFEPAIIRTVADALPEAELHRRPRWIGLRQYVHHLLTSPSKPPVFPEADPRALDHLEAGDRVGLLTGRAAALRTRGMFADAAAAAEDARDALQRLDDADRTELEPFLPTLMTQWGATFAAAGELPAAIDVLLGAASLAERTGSLRAEMEALGELAWINAAAGEGAHADRCIARADALRRRHPDVQRIRGGLALAKAYRASDALDVERAIALLDGHEESFEELGIIAASLRSILGARARSADPVDMLSRLEVEVENSPAPRTASGFNAAFVAIGRATLLSYQGLHEAAILALDACPALPRPATGVLRTRRAVALLGLGELDAAVREASRETSSVAPRARTEALVVRAAALLRLGNHASAVTSFRLACELSEEHGLRASLSVVPAADLGALGAAAGLPPAAELVAARDVLTPSPSYRYERLSPQQLAVVRALVDHEQVAQAASALGLSPNTVKTHLQAAYRRLGATDRTSALEEAGRRGLL